MDENLSRGYCQLRMGTPDEAPPPLGDMGPHSPSGDTRGGPGRSGSSQSSSHSPKDNCSCIYLALVLCGAGFLLPYNSFITAADYYLDRYPGSTIIFDMSLTYICLALLSVITNNFLVELFSLRTRITFGYILSFSMLLFIALTDIWYEIFQPEVSYRVTLVAVGTVALGCTVQQSSFYGYTSMLPPRYTQAVMVGESESKYWRMQIFDIGSGGIGGTYYGYTSMLPPRYTQAVMVGESAAGLITSVNRVLTKALMPGDPKINTIIFFSISIATVLICFFVFHVSMRSEFVKYHVTHCKMAGIADDQRGITALGNPEEVDILDGTVSRDSYGVLVIHSPTSPPPNDVTSGHDAQAPGHGNLSTRVTHQNEVQIRGQGHAYRRHISKWDAVKRGCINRYRASRHVWPYMVSIAMAYFVTLCLFPGVESEIVSCRLHSWMPVMLIGAFNLFDFIGKIIASVPYPWPSGRLVLLTTLRVMLVPLLMLCAAPRIRPVLQGEAWPLGLSIILGLSNGYFGSVPMILAPSRVPDEQKELTGNMMTLSYSLGLTTGSAVAYLLDDWLGPHPIEDPCVDHVLYNVTGLPFTYMSNSSEINSIYGFSHISLYE